MTIARILLTKIYSIIILLHKLYSLALFWIFFLILLIYWSPRHLIVVFALYI